MMASGPQGYSETMQLTIGNNNETISFKNTVKVKVYPENS
jgi:hypothetical protein